MFSIFTKAHRVARGVHAGRRALLRRDVEKAREYFEQAAKIDPSYIRTASRFNEGVLTYLGRAQYAAGLLAEAKQSLERALAIYDEDILARLYLGMAMLRLDDETAGLRELQEGLQQLHVWLEDSANRGAFEGYWDPNGQIRSEIRNALSLIVAKSAEANLFVSAEWIGHEVEAEMDRARQDESRDRQRW